MKKLLLSTFLLVSMSCVFAQNAWLNAGPDQIIRVGETAQLAAKAYGFHGVIWRTLGSGTFNNKYLLKASYTPSAEDVKKGKVYLIVYNAKNLRMYDVMVLGIARCNKVDIPIASDTICVSNGTTYDIAATVSGKGFHAQWSTDGSGIFSDEHATASAYTPSSSDITDGSVWLKLSVYDSLGHCPVIADSLFLQLSPPAQVNAGPDIQQCGSLSGGEMHLNALATYADEITWTTNGSGTFSDPNEFGTRYFYTVNDVNLGSLELYATVKSGACLPFTDTVKVTMHTASELVFPVPSVSQIGSEGVSVEVYVYGPNTEGMWTSTGSGTFSDPYSHATAYYPSTEDAQNGCVQLIFTTFDPEGPCGSVSGSMSACFNPPCGVVEAGGDLTVCGYEEGGAVSLSATYSGGNAEQVTWGTSGNGGFDDPNSLNTTYYYDASDVNNAYVDLYVSVSGYGCSSADVVRIYLQAAPYVQVPEPSVYQCDGQAVYANVYLYGYASSGTWFSTGSGTFSDPASTYTTYYPSEYEGNTCVELVFVTNDPEGPCGPSSGSMSACFYPCGDGSDARKESSEVGSSPTVGLFPNPAKDNVTLTLNQETSLIELYLTDVNGNRWDTILKSDNSVDISQLTAGIYSLHVRFSDGDTKAIRFVKH